ncbi:MAG TPA: GNAT family N-acetyltransferase [Pirellulales bacterium]|nr:GNAT family N-acetyltransferase [Pirellulales bacterium]
MSAILHLVKTLERRPLPPLLSGARLRQFGGPDDAEVWLNLRQRSFAGEAVGVRPWTRADFEAEFLARSWWSPERLWFAETERETGGQVCFQSTGTIALAQRGELPVIHWLCVSPDCRRRGIGRLLMAALETRCWDAGRRVVGLETHAQWSAAVKFYTALGYIPPPPHAG